MYPFMSPYLHVMRRSRLSVPGLTPSPWDEIDTHPDPTPGTPAAAQRTWDVMNRSAGSTGDGTTGTADGPDRDSRRRGIYSGLTALGINLLEAAPRGDFGGGLARGAAAFSEAYGGSLDRDRQLAMERREEARRAAAESRAQSADARAAAQEGRAVESHSLDLEQGREQLDAFRRSQAQAKAHREATGKSAAQMAADIQGLADAHPDNPKLQIMARRAAGYALGEDSDTDKLANLHAQMTDEAFWQSDVDRESAAKITHQRREIDAGVANDPRADDARADRQLSLEDRRLKLYESQGGPGGGSRRAPTTAQRTDDILAEARRILAEKRKAAESRGDVVLPGVEAKWRQEAMAEATRTIDALYGGGNGITVDVNGNPTEPLRSSYDNTGFFLPGPGGFEPKTGSFDHFAEKMGTADRARSLRALGPEATDEQIRNYSQQNLEVRGRPEQDPQIAQQLEAIERAVGPLMADDRRRIALQLSIGELSIGQTIGQLTRLRADWRP